MFATAARHERPMHIAAAASAEAPGESLGTDASSVLATFRRVADAI